MTSIVAQTTQRIVLTLAIAAVVAAPAMAKEGNRKLDAAAFDGADLAGHELDQHWHCSCERQCGTGRRQACEFRA